jgi:hypothetical protein
LLAFAHIEKTAGTSLKFVLRSSFGLRHCNLLPAHPDGIVRPDDVAFARRVHVFGLSCISGHGLVRPTHHVGTELDGRPIAHVTLLREPRARCLSHFLHHKRVARRQGQSLSFAAFIADERMHDVQVRMLAGAPDLEAAKAELARFAFVGLTEHFAASLVALDRLVPHRLRLRLRRLHVTPNVDDRSEVLEDPDSARLLEDANRLDQALYDHVAREVFPALLARAGPALPEGGTSTRYWLNRWFQKGIYRGLAKRRRGRFAT